ncbi:MAG: Daunorubicin/doxorubicin resistance transporter ATP-binding protein DrrA [Thermoleophilia bacterium]|nr:Daunorubicin/doxorubicin resistance transporter ATP-binding protein DrrA [Thermoleophilia bacterium]
MVYEEAVRSTVNGIEARGLGKRYGDLWALRGLDLDVPAGSVLGLLGHNGAGKTTAIRILTTLTAATEGTARVAGLDVATDAPRVRGRIGVASQSATVDGLLTARANLDLLGALYHLPRAEVRRRREELLERLDLGDAADRIVKTYSGGMRRRLDLAASLIARPPVLFLDEPTTGLDPRSRNDLWELLREVVAEGATLLLTTQYLDEADQLADDIVLLDQGRVAARGTPAELKSAYGGERLVVTVTVAAELAPARAALEPFLGGAAVTIEEATRELSASITSGTRLVEVVRALDAAGVDVLDVHRREATLDDAFLAITGADSPAAPTGGSA